MLTWITLTLAAALMLWAIMMFNRLVRLRNQMCNALAAVKGYVSHDQAVLTAVTQLRSEALAQQASPARLYPIESALEQALTRLFALQEAYPDLKASDNFLKLQTALVEVEDHLQYARRYYNGAVRDHNDAVQRVPDLVIARAFGFHNGEFYQAGEDERAAVKVSMS